MNQSSIEQLQKVETVRTLAARLQVSEAEALRMFEESARKLSKEQDDRIARLSTRGREPCTRVTTEQLENQAAALNGLLNRPAVPWTCRPARWAAGRWQTSET